MKFANLFKFLTYQVFSPGALVREKYEAFKSLLDHDQCAHEAMAEIEEIYHQRVVVDFTVIQEKYERLAGCVGQILEDFYKLNPSRYLSLGDYYKKFDFYIRFMLAPPDYCFSPPFIVPLADMQQSDARRIGGKAQNLIKAASQLGLPIPNGFVVTTNAFYYFLEYNNLMSPISAALAHIDINSPASLNAVSQRLTQLIANAEMPGAISDAIYQAYEHLNGKSDKKAAVAVRSSAAGEDSEISFAGQYKTVLNVPPDRLSAEYKTVIASKYSPNALFYRISYGLLDIEIPMAVLVLEMIDAESSGVVYTRDPLQPESGRLTIHAVQGLGDSLVGGKTASDRIVVSTSERPEIVQKKAVNKIGTVAVEDDVSLQLANWGKRLESLFNTPQDMEWCRNAAGHLYLLQTRPLKTDSAPDMAGPTCRFDAVENTVLLRGGESAASGIGAGRIFNATRESDIDSIAPESVLVAKNASPHYVKVMNRLSAVVTDSGSTAGHFVSVAREFGVPAIVNTGTATMDLKDGQTVTVWADNNIVYEGIIPEMVDSPCARNDHFIDSPYMRKLRYVMRFVSPLRLIDPQAPDFIPEKCRSLHDIIRFAHEKAVNSMFSMGTRRFTRKKGARRLISSIPMQIYLLDVGGGIRSSAPSTEKSVYPEDIRSIPMKALWKGLNHPNIVWGSFSHFDWAEYDKIVMGGGIISADSALFSSYAVLSGEYLNLSLKFGYHFVVLDALCGAKSEKNYILFRFAGGGGDLHGKTLRAEFLNEILDRLDFEIDKKGDLVDARLKTGDQKTLQDRLDMIGRLLGATRLMDMYLKDAIGINGYVEDFMNGTYHFVDAENVSHRNPGV